MSMSRKPGLVSVVITNHNRAPYLRECLNSLKVQTYPNFEIILIDDASTDESLFEAQLWRDEHRDFFSRDNQMIIHALPRNVGFSGALNVGLYLAEGEYIAIQDSDDYSHPERFAKQVAFLEQHPAIALVGSNYYSFEQGHPSQMTLAQWIKYGDQIRTVYAQGGHCVCHGTIMFRGSLFDEIGGPTRRIKGAEDYEFIAKALNAKARIDNLPEPLYYYRVHDKQRSIEFYKRQGKEG